MYNFNTDRTETILTLCKGLFELSSDGFLLVDKDGRILFINQTYCHQLGVKQVEAIGMPVQQIVKNTLIIDKMKEKDYAPEHNVIWAVNPGQYKSDEKHAVISRQVIADDRGEIIGAVGQVKFIKETLELSGAIQKLNDELYYLKNEVFKLDEHMDGFGRIVGNSKTLREAKELARKASHNDFPVLITGESGTGKEVFANAIHFASKRQKQPIIRVNCAAIPEELFESELFGYSEGAFTGAKRGGKKGKIMLANHGTLFLDEIGEMPFAMQAKLLRVLQEQEVELVGGEKSIPVDIRIISATNKDIHEEVQKKRFRLDLYYRLNVVEMSIPPLRERREDIAVLAGIFLQEVNEKYSSHAYFAPDVSEFLSRYQWPGNIRELRNVVERAYMLADGKEIRPEHCPLYFSVKDTHRYRLSEHSFDVLKANFERELLKEALEQCGGNVRKCANF